MSTKDVLQIIVSDFHSGSNYALFPDRVWEGRQGNTHAPNSMQIKIRKQFFKFCDEVKKKRKDKRIVMVHNGDAIDGDHHDSNDVCTRESKQQADIHIELMDELQNKIGWQRGDKLYYTKGTQTHVKQYENYIAGELNAVQGEDGSYLFDFLSLESNGVISWFAHHGPKRGKGPNRGNALRNWVRNIYYEALQDGRQYPHVIYSGHVHDPDYTVYSAQVNGFRFVNLHAVICPSWQYKTVYAWEKAPVSINRIGGVIHEIKADGTICVPEFCVMET